MAGAALPETAAFVERYDWPRVQPLTAVIGSEAGQTWYTTGVPAVYDRGMADATIKVSPDTRDRLAALAAAGGTTIGAQVALLVERQPTAEQIAEQIAEGRRLLREHFGMTLTDAELDQGPDLLQRVYGIAAADTRAKVAPRRSA
ncbi:hypothetical protein P3T29_005216 [Kitasatospora sp. MAP5-34]|nr:hypothetical protein [Kitasatospora sp. MAP5-34]